MQKRQVKETVTTSMPQSSFVRFIRSIAALSVVFVQIALPLAPVFANEEISAVPASPDVEVIAPAPEVVPESEPEIAPPSLPPETSDIPLTEQPLSEDENSSDLPVVAPVVTDVVPVTDESQPEIVNDSDIAPLEEVISTDPVEDQDIETASSTLPDDVSQPTEEETGDVIEDAMEDATVPDVRDAVGGENTENDEGAPSDEATTTLVTVVAPELHTVTNDENRFSFGVDDCAQVADGSFYCRTKEETLAVPESDRVFAGPDIDGDNEIYIERDGKATQLTFNQVDDAAPYYDPLSDTIVWHRLVDARYQIVSYSLTDGEETVLTMDHYNNMQPSRMGNLTVWQGWVGNDWEILLKEGDEITMLTDNTFHDIGPQINGDYVIWQAEEAEGWKVKVYNRLTKEIESIADADGASIENPRFVLLYDAKQQNGDVETKGYDLESGANVPLGAKPHQVPDQIPDPDQTGEDRAFIVGTTQLKTKTEDDAEPDTTPDPIDDPLLSTGTSTDDVVIPPFVPDTGSVVSGSSSEVPSLATSTDLIVEPLIEPIEEPVIENLVVPPYIPTVVEELDSQDPVATSS